MESRSSRLGSLLEALGRRGSSSAANEDEQDNEPESSHDVTRLIQSFYMNRQFRVQSGSSSRNPRSKKDLPHGRRRDRVVFRQFFS